MEQFSKTQLRAIIVPLLIDQLLNVLVGMADTIMVSSVGEAAVSGVSLVDTLNLLFLMLFAGLATGGAILCAQKIGCQRHKEANRIANQLMLTLAGISVLVLVISLLFQNFILGLLFGGVEQAVMDNATVYFKLTALSIPALALYNGGAAILRAAGDAKTPMKISMIMNGCNIGGNALCLYGLHMGIYGVAIPTLLSRILAVLLIWIQLHKEGKVISFREFTLHPKRKVIFRILSVAIPNSVESGIFQIGKILVMGLVAGLGTRAITANAVANSVLTFQTITEDAMGLAMITIVGQCVGAGEMAQARAYTGKLMKWTYLMMWAVNIPMFLCSGIILQLYNMSPETAQMAKGLLWYNCAFGLTIWPAAFTLPNAIRASGNVCYTMIVSVASMWLFRIALSYILVRGLGYGLWAIYICFGVDWIVRAVFFVLAAVRWRRK